MFRFFDSDKNDWWHKSVPVSILNFDLLSAYNLCPGSAKKPAARWTGYNEWVCEYLSHHVQCSWNKLRVDSNPD